MKADSVALRVQAHCRTMAQDLKNYTPDQIRARLEYIVTNAEALAKLREDRQNG